MANSLTYYVERLGSLRSERSSFIPHWRELSENYLTRQARFTTSDRNKGDKRNHKIINEAGMMALRTLTSGMMSGMTNPAMPWFNLQTPDPDLNKFRPVKIWLGLFRDRMREFFLRSNLYSTFPMAYRDEGCFGGTAYLMLEDPESLLRSYHYPVGSYMLACDDRGRIDTCYREFEMTARQMVKRFGEQNCSQSVKSLAKRGGSKESWIPITHAIESNDEYDPRNAQMSYYKKIKSCYFEPGSNENKFLQESGYDQFPVMAPRWDVTGEDVYGSDCPGMQALGTHKQIQFREKRKGQLIDKGTNPPMGAPVSMKNKASSVLPGDVTYFEQTAVGQKFEPLYQLHPAFYEWVLQDIASCTDRVRRAFFEDLFLMLANDFRSNVTAREIAERHEEKLLQLGPVLLRQNDEHYDPLISWASQVMFKNRVVPPPPQELSGMALNVKYTSILSQALEMMGVASIERLTSYVGTVSAAKPGAADLFDEDQAVILYAAAVGAPETLIRDDKVVAQMREVAKKKEQLARAVAIAAPAADAASAAKNLSETNVQTDNALTRITQPQQPQVAA